MHDYKNYSWMQTVCYDREPTVIIWVPVDEDVKRWEMNVTFHRQHVKVEARNCTLIEGRLWGPVITEDTGCHWEVDWKHQKRYIKVLEAVMQLS
mmetsp:Transcript_15199/g.28727  ORF Transcript_15199/g.28727 Transcript_15199/m.28727 type:complete len:94 (+) Transcript_15199:434-715(+)